MHEGGFINICLGYEKDILIESKLLVVNLRLIISPITLVKYDVQNDKAEFL
jgi:hypothetical protein